MPEQKYKKSVMFILCALVAAYFFSISWVLTGYHFPAPDTVWVDDLYKKKEAYARSFKGPKIVVVSGSSGLFGVSASDIEKHFKIPTINLSTHAGLKDYYFYRARNSLKSGDLVILSPEYDQFFSDLPMSSVKSDYIVNYDKPYFKKMSFKETSSILQTYAHPWKIVKNWASSFGLGHAINGKKPPGGYQSVNLNRNGDETSNFGRKKKVVDSIYFPKQFVPDTFGMKKISGFIRWCQTQNIAVLVSWPGTLIPDVETTDANSKFLASLIVFLKGSGVEVLGRPQDFFVTDNYLFDTVYHLNQEGVSLRTSKIIGLLEENPTFQGWRKNAEDGGGGVLSKSFKQVDIDVCYNGEMELAEDNKVSGWRAVTGGNENPDGIAAPDNTEAHGGKHSLKLTNTSGGQVRWVGEKVALPAGIYKIHAGGWSKAENIEKSAIYCINIKTFFKDGSFQWNMRGLSFSKGSHDWEQSQSVINFDKEVVAVQPFLILYSSVSGTAWFDDVFIRVQTAGGAGV